MPQTLTVLLKVPGACSKLSNPHRPLRKLSTRTSDSLAKPLLMSAVNSSAVPSEMVLKLLSPPQELRCCVHLHGGTFGITVLILDSTPAWEKDVESPANGTPPGGHPLVHSHQEAANPTDLARFQSMWKLFAYAGCSDGLLACSTASHPFFP